VTTPDGEYGAGVGVYGVCNGSHWSMGVYGTSTNGDGVVGFSSSGHGVSAQGGLAGVRGTGGNYGVRGTGVYGVRGEGSATGVGVEGTGQTGVSATGTANGVVATGSSYGVHGTGAFGIFGIGETGVYGEGTTAAGDFNGHVRVSGDLTVAGTKMFVIDHPQDPANKTLAHACVEAPEALNVYSGTATLDARGRVVIRLPGYVTSLNREYRYQLTPLGGPAPELHIAREVENSRFAIAGGSPGQRVCWIVTGLRDDPWTRKHPMRVERRKRRRDQGTYLNPELYGMPRSASVQRPPKLEKPSKLPKAPKLRKALKPPDLPRLRRRRRGASVAAVG
jgi:hypothetical protein